MTDLMPQAAVGARPGAIAFPRLVGVELRRLWWRRLTKVVLLAAVVVTGVTVYTAYVMTSPETIAQGIDLYERQVAEFPQHVTECRQAQQSARDAGESTADFGCEQMQTPKPEDFGIANPHPAAVLGGLLRTNSPFYTLLAFLLGASFVAAEFTTGSMGTWLTFQPRRLRVALSKLGAAVGGGVLVAGAGFGLAAIGAWLISVVNRPDSELHVPLTADIGEPLSHLILRHGLVILGAGAVGAALALVVRNTGAVMGLAVGYGIVVEGVLGQGVAHGRLTPWLVTPNVTGFLDRGMTYPVERCTGAACDYVTERLSSAHGSIYLGVLVVLLAGLALESFRRRDAA